MASLAIYTRVYSNSSAGQLASSKPPRGSFLSDAELIDEFTDHSNKGSRVPTALVSVSVRIIDTLNRAFCEHYVDGETAADIWLIFIEVPSTIPPDSCRIHSAKALADESRHPKPHLFTYEKLFEWAIPEQNDPNTLSNSAFKSRIAERIRCAERTGGSWDIGLYLGFFAQSFGARAPLNWICWKLSKDCVKITSPWFLDDDMVEVDYGEGHFKHVDSEFFRNMEDVFETVLIDWWWLTSDKFLSEFQEYKESREEDEIRFWEAHHVEGLDGTVEDLSEVDKAYHNSVLDAWEAYWENEAVKMGLQIISLIEC